MTFSELLEWQWSDYSDKHRNYNSLLIHIFAVPLFWIGALDFIGALLFRGALFGIGGLIMMGISVFLQGKGHEMEKAEPAPFKGPADFAQRILAEQFITFPRFVLTGGWWSNLRAGS
jgi:hypothetical protein